MLRALIVGAVIVAGLVPAAAAAQSTGELTLFNRGQFKGGRMAIAGPRQGIDPAMTVRSLTVPPGTQWELCSGSKFSGCRQYSQSQPAMVMTVRSVRPIAPVLTATGSAPPGGSGGAGGQSLRGWASEFFVSPDVNGNRVQVQSGTAEGMSQQARDFCRSRGWRSSGHQRVQTVGANTYLADVLCVDSDN
jgi:hypothetical protein